MAKLKVLIEVDEDVWKVLPAIARHLELPSDAQTAQVASLVFDALAWEAYLQSQEGKASTLSYGGYDVNAAVSDILDPDVRLPLTIRAAVQQAGESTGLTLLEFFDEYLAGLGGDEWIAKVLEKTDEEDPILWRMAAATVYQVIKGDERRLPETWGLIERTYLLIKRGFDNGTKPGHNGNVESSTKQPLKPQKE